MAALQIQLRAIVTARVVSLASVMVMVAMLVPLVSATVACIAVQGEVASSNNSCNSSSSSSRRGSSSSSRRSSGGGGGSSGSGSRAHYYYCCYY